LILKKYVVDVLRLEVVTAVLLRVQASSDVTSYRWVSTDRHIFIFRGTQCKKVLVGKQWRWRQLFSLDTSLTLFQATRRHVLENLVFLANVFRWGWRRQIPEPDHFHANSNLNLHSTICHTSYTPSWCNVSVQFRISESCWTPQILNLLQALVQRSVAGCSTVMPRSLQSSLTNRIYGSLSIFSCSFFQPYYPAPCSRFIYQLMYEPLLFFRKHKVPPHSWQQ
jgi:hypothetical protein